MVRLQRQVTCQLTALQLRPGGTVPATPNLLSQLACVQPPHPLLALPSSLFPTMKLFPASEGTVCPGPHLLRSVSEGQPLVHLLLSLLPPPPRLIIIADIPLCKGTIRPTQGTIRPSHGIIRPSHGTICPTPETTRLFSETTRLNRGHYHLSHGIFLS